MKRKAFTLIEMLVVIGIVAILMAAVISAVSRMTRIADRARCQELISNTSTAMLALFQQEGAWPRAMIRNHNSEDGLDARAALPLAKGGYMSLTTQLDGQGKVKALAGFNKFGIVTPWATARMKSSGKDLSLDSKVPTGGKIRDHVFRYALDLEGDGIVEAKVGEETVRMRANVALWCCGKDGKLEPYSLGVRRDDIYSWTDGQTRGVSQ